MKKEETLEFLLDFKKLKSVANCSQDVVPVVVQDAQSLEVLNIAYVDQSALDYTLSTGRAAFWSTSRDELWIKGATSGDYLEVTEVSLNCEQNSLVYKVNLLGKSQCHTQRKSCYYRKIQWNSSQKTLEFIDSSSCS